ncbi:MecA protein [Bacillus pseudomycoides]|uniref:penicillin-binding transpeptidase domain-containing protein n=3 Tax=Bacillus pseudomycoides TaxID=64104 RepID=UPI000BED71B1|nr:penicillin-binding transpeptidase domain-containing protein [Bacillus pseudomycoides]PDY44439.1 MecA protein [Bacillus pseudomycoides]PED72383.1 MecA protein [Bacillus pseudomycoides]PEJ81590.1 MecA protein [Bacillus pseudomycoides]PEM18233.1 MecA protein [Bacillus pseudomycoides]PEO91764.1 MecA protein [Bacillus pseudomycoides]
MKKIWILLFFCFTFILVGCNKGETSEQAFETYIKLWNDKKFADMYDQLSKHAKESISKKEFTEKNEKIYEGIGVENLKIKREKVSKDKTESEVILFTVSMDTAGGEISFSHEATLVKEKDGDKKSWKINWTPDFIFPGMKKNYKVRLQTEQGKRGEIYDRNGKGLVVNGKATEVGIIPEKLGDTGTQTKETIAQLLNMSIEEVDQKLTAKWIKPDSYVPIGILPEGRTQSDYISLEGVSSRPVKVRTYPLGEAAAHLTGYIGEVNAEELKLLQKKGYQADDLVGKTGLEKVLENKLRGEKGGRVFMEDENGKEIKNLAKTEARDGENVTLTIDASIQEKIYNEMKNEAGSSAAINPKTGETIALVSSPAYNPNIIVRGASKAQREVWNNDLKNPMINRFTQAVVPGSVFKTITGAIGLEAKVINPTEEFKIEGLKWTKDSSWGNYYVTRVKDASPIDFDKAMKYSDNIYFAQKALKIGKDQYESMLKKFGFHEKLPIEYEFPISIIAKDGIKNDIQLADTGYGQGQVLMTPLHLALTYAPIVNEGNIPSPHLIQKEVKNWKENVISKESQRILKSALIKVINDPDGAGKIARIDDMTLAGKTGTAELKESKEADGKELGWFAAFDANAPDMIITMMIEDVKGRGGSNVPGEKIKHIFQK